MEKMSLILVHVFNPLNPLSRFAIKLGRETQPCQHEALCVVGNVNQSHFACWFIFFIIWISKPVSLGHSTSYPVMFMIVDSMCARVVRVCVHVRLWVVGMNVSRVGK